MAKISGFEHIYDIGDWTTLHVGEMIGASYAAHRSDRITDALR